MEDTCVKKALLVLAVAVALAAGVRAGDDNDKNKDKDDKDQNSGHFEFKPGTLVVSRSVYQGNAGTVTVGQVLPPGCPGTPINLTFTVKVPVMTSFGGGTTSVSVSCGLAVADGTYPNVFQNDGPDASFGVTSPIFLDNVTESGKLLGTLPIPPSQIVTSFSSKSELALNLSLDKKSITFGGYVGGPGFTTGVNQLDVSNSNTPGVIDPTNPVVSQYYRSVAEVDADGHLMVTDGNAYSGNNGRAAIKGNSI